MTEPQMSYKRCLPLHLPKRAGEGRHGEGRGRFRSVLASVVPVLISVEFPLPAGQGAPAFFSRHYKGHGFEGTY